MKSLPITRFFTTLAMATSLIALACSRDLPSEWPESSSASNSAQELPAANVTLALDGDPPLPGEPAEGWIGLEQPPSEDPHAHHRHHGGHGAPAANKPATDKPATDKPAAHEGHGGHHHGH
jgi:hypothetical protein